MMHRRSFLRLLGLGAACAAIGIKASSLPAEPEYRAEPKSVRYVSVGEDDAADAEPRTIGAPGYHNSAFNIATMERSLVEPVQQWGAFVGRRNVAPSIYFGGGF